MPPHYSLTAGAARRVQKTCDRVMGQTSPAIRDWSQGVQQPTFSFGRNFDGGILASGATTSTRTVVVFAGTYVYRDEEARKVASWASTALTIPTTSASASETYHHVFLRREAPSSPFVVATASGTSFTDFAACPVSSSDEFMLLYTLRQKMGNFPDIVPRFRWGGLSQSAIDGVLSSAEATASAIASSYGLVVAGDSSAALEIVGNEIGFKGGALYESLNVESSGPNVYAFGPLRLIVNI